MNDSKLLTVHKILSFIYILQKQIVTELYLDLFVKSTVEPICVKIFVLSKKQKNCVVLRTFSKVFTELIGYYIHQIV